MPLNRFEMQREIERLDSSLAEEIKKRVMLERQLIECEEYIEAMEKAREYLIPQASKEIRVEVPVRRDGENFLSRLREWFQASEK